MSTDWKHLHDLQLADPKFFEPGKIDLLLGVQEMAELMLPGVIKGNQNTPMAQQTKIGWVLSGACGLKSNPEIQCHLATVATEEQQLTELLKAFWTLEEVQVRSHR